MRNEDEMWQEHALCQATADVDLFFDPERETAAKAVCADCVVTTACLEYALQTKQADGVWGGTTPLERRRARRVRRRRFR